MPKKQKVPRIVVYGVGKYGQYIVRLATAKGWKIVAAFNRAGAKVGQDAGRLAGLDQGIGVVVQDCDIADFSSLDADIGIVAMTDRIAQNFPAYKRLMNAGLNVICHGGEAYYPAGANAKLAQEIDQIAKRNKVTFLGTGIWDISRTWSALLVTGNCTEIRSLFHRSVTNSEGFDIATVLGTGTGMTAQEFSQKISGSVGIYGNLYTLIPQHVLSALGYSVTSCTERREPVLSDRPMFCKTLDRELAPGVCVGTRTVIEATTTQGVTCTAHMEVRPLFGHGEVEHMMWAVDGTPSSRIVIERDDSRYATASSMFNRIPDVIAAPPGIQLVSQLGPMRHTALWRG
jgi:4-hydroxy-tetrahydrodipicolinate reductase